MTEERSNLDEWSPWTRHLPADYMDPPVWLKLTSLGAEERQRYVTRSLTTGQFFEGEWCPNRSSHHWRPITAEDAERLCDEKVLEYRGVRHWLELFGEPATVKPSPQGAHGWLSPTDLAVTYGVPYGALRRRLERWRRINDDGWMEVPRSERRHGDAKYLYRPDAIKEVINALAECNRRK